MTPQEEGRQFEREISAELGLQQTPSSGSQWYEKLDLRGIARWSLKFTRQSSFRLQQSDIDEAVNATSGIAGDGRIPIWLIRIGSPVYDMVLLRKEDFKAMQNGEIQILDIPKARNSDLRRARAKIPVLMREENDTNEN